MSKKGRRVVVYFLYLFSVWSCFRFFIKLPEVIEELWFKPVLWLTPLFWWAVAEGKSWDLFKGKNNAALIWGGVLGVAVFLVIRYVRQDWLWRLDMTKAMMGLVVASVEQMTFAGAVLIMLSRLYKGGELKAGVVTALMFAAVHLPINVLVYRLNLTQLFGVFVLNFFVSYLANWVRLRTNNVLSSVIVQWSYLLAII